MSDFGKVAVMLGGRSAERAVSLKSGSMVLAALLKKGVDAHPFDPQDQPLDQLADERFDRAFIALHGGHGELVCPDGRQVDQNGFYRLNCRLHVCAGYIARNRVFECHYRQCSR